MVKKKIAMRVASLALCAVFTGMLFGAPKSKAVVAETAIGTAAVASYFQATGLTMAASAGSTGALVTTGIADIAGSYAMATGAASSGSAFLSSLATGVSISPAGALVLTAAAVVAIGALVAWYVSEKGLDEAGSTAVAVPGTSDTYSYNGISFPAFPSEYLDRCSVQFIVYGLSSGVYRLYLCTDCTLSFGSDSSMSNAVISENSAGFGMVGYTYQDGMWGPWFNDFGAGYTSAYIASDVSLIWSNVDFFSLGDNSIISLPSSVPVPVGDNVQNQLEVTRTPEFIQLDTEYDVDTLKEMAIDLGYPAGTTLDTVAEEVPDLIATGTLAPTYEITSTETGEGTNPEPDTDDEAVYPYFPVLSGIRDRLDNLGKSIVDGIMDGLASLFVPSEAYLEALPERITDTFDERTGFLTYPFSLLPDFVDRLSSSSSDWILRWPQIVEPFSNAVLFQAGSFNVSAFMRNNSQIHYLYELYRLMAKVFMSFGFVSLCYYKYRSVVGDNYGGM